MFWPTSQRLLRAIRSVRAWGRSIWLNGYIRSFYRREIVGFQPICKELKDFWCSVISPREFSGSVSFVLPCLLMPFIVMEATGVFMEAKPQPCDFFLVLGIPDFRIGAVVRDSQL